MAKFITGFIFPVIFGTLTACSPQPTGTLVATPLPSTTQVSPTATETDTPTPEPDPPRLLTICMGQEPSSLFIYADSTSAARGVQQALYDGPFDVRDFSLQPIILERIPSLDNGDALLREVEVEPGELIADHQGNLVTLAGGVSYRPSGCLNASCLETYAGDETVSMDELVLHFKLMPELRWSDGTPLQAEDSVYSFEVAKALFAASSPASIRFARSYQATDAFTLEWVGVPGYQSPLAYTYFFSPLPKHVWGHLTPEELLSAPMSTRQPLGWGPYILDEWVSGDHISFSRNPNYFRASEGLPYFDYLVYRFVPNGEAALEALLVGECDLVDSTTSLDQNLPTVLELQESGRVEIAFQMGTAWEQTTFGIESLDPQHLDLFASQELRQAVAKCIDRQGLVDTLFFGHSRVPDTYIPPMHPLSSSEVASYDFDPQAAMELLDGLGWVDSDQDPATPRIARSVTGLPDGTELSFTYLTSSEAERENAAQMIQASLRGCGIFAQVVDQDWESLLAPGPEGPVFGRMFDVAQFAWTGSLEPPCSLYMSSEIPGPYPEFSKSWGGGNAAGYSNPQFDGYCLQASQSLPDSVEYREAHEDAQILFAEDLPALPLYLRFRLVVHHPDMCGPSDSVGTTQALIDLEIFDYGDGCER
jgi:peptide/nickel transport system substrate-binding protein